MKHAPVRPMVALIALLVTAGCATTSRIDLSAPDAAYRLSSLNRKASAGTVTTRVPQGTPSPCTGDRFSVKSFEVGRDSTRLDLTSRATVVLPTECLHTITRARKGRGAATGFGAGAAIGGTGGLIIAGLAAFVTALGGEELGWGKASAMIGFSALTVGAVGAGFGWIRGAPARYRFTPGTPPAPEPEIRQSSVSDHRDSTAEPIPAGELREYIVPHTTAPLAIDGRLDEPAWQSAPFTEDFVLYADGETPQQATKARMLWDDTALYIAFTLEDRDAWATMTNHDDRLWEEEAAEVFIDPDGDGLDYVELQVNALGATLDLLMSKAYSEGGSGDFEWTLDGFTAGVVVDGSPEPGSEDRGWTVEMALPFAGLQAVAPSMNFPPRPGDTWRINLCRMEAAFGDRSTLEASAWNQTDSRGFHVPERFGRIVFAAE